MQNLPTELDCQVRPLTLREPVRIANHTLDDIPCLHVQVRRGEHVGRGEAVHQQLPEGIAIQIRG